MQSKGKIAIHTQDSIAQRKMFLFEVLIKACASMWQRIAMLASFAIHVVKREKFYMGFSATRALNTTVNSKDFYFQHLSIVLGLGYALYSMHYIIGMAVRSLFLTVVLIVDMVVKIGLFFMRPIIGFTAFSLFIFISIWHKQTASYPTHSLLQEQAGSRQLISIIQQKEVVCVS